MSSKTAPAAEDARTRLQTAKRALYREAIVLAAEAVFAEVGYDAAKVQQVARRAGVSLATFYATFPSKEAVHRAVQQLRLGELMREVGQRIARAPDTFERLRAGIEGYLRFHMAHPAFLRLQLHEKVPWGTTDQLRTAEQTEAWGAGLKMLTAAFRQGMAEGFLVHDDPELCARTATAMSQVRLALWIDRGMQTPAAEVATEALRQWVRAFALPARAEALLARLEGDVPRSPPAESAR